MKMLKYESSDFSNIDVTPGKTSFPESIAQIAQKKFDEWLSQQPKAYSMIQHNSIWMKCEPHSVPPTYKFSCYLIPVEEK